MTTSSISLRRRPDVLQKDVLARAVHSERLMEQVDVHGPRQRVSHHQRRRGEIVHLDLGVDPALEVPVAGQHRHHGEVGVLDGLADLGDQRAGVADARRAPVSHQVEAQLLQVRREAGPLVVVHDHLRTGRERRLDPRLAGHALVDGVLGQQRGTEHHRRVGGVRARRDGRDGDGAVVELEHGAVREGDRRGLARGRRPVRTAGAAGSPFVRGAELFSPV